MSEARDKWERSYANTPAEGQPAELLRRFAEHIDGPVLDLACGSGRNGLYLARRGCEVDFIDLAFTPLQRVMTVARMEGLRVRAIQADLETMPLPTNRYGAVLNFRYLQRSLWQPMRAAVRVGGLIVFETFTVAQARHGHPRNPDFLLRPGELHAAFADWEIVHEYEGPDGEAADVAQLVAYRR